MQPLPPSLSWKWRPEARSPPREAFLGSPGAGPGRQVPGAGTEEVTSSAHGGVGAKPQPVHPPSPVCEAKVPLNRCLPRPPPRLPHGCGRPAGISTCTGTRLRRLESAGPTPCGGLRDGRQGPRGEYGPSDGLSRGKTQPFTSPWMEGRKERRRRKEGTLRSGEIITLFIEKEWSPMDGKQSRSPPRGRGLGGHEGQLPKTGRGLTVAPERPRRVGGRQQRQWVSFLRPRGTGPLTRRPLVNASLGTRVRPQETQSQAHQPR